MPNISHTTEHPFPRPANLTSGVVMLRQALGSRATVELPTDEAGEAPGEVIVRWVGASGEPERLRLVPWAAHQDDQAESGHRSTPLVVWVLHRSSAAQRDALRARGEQFIDLGGTVHLTLPWALIDRTDLTPVRPSTGKLGSKADPFADRGSLVLRTMIEQQDRQRAWGVRELAAEAGVGVATASDVVRALVERGLASMTRRGRTSEIRMAELTAVISAWTRAYDWRMNRGIMVQIPMGDPARFLKRLPRLMHPRYRWALTLQAGASLVAPHATWDRVHVYVDVPTADRADSTHVLATIAARAGWPAATDGRLVLMVPQYATSAWHGLRTIGTLPVVSDLQLVLDLWHYPLRGREQAEHLLGRTLERPASNSPPPSNDPTGGMPVARATTPGLSGPTDA